MSLVLPRIVSTTLTNHVLYLQKYSFNVRTGTNNTTCWKCISEYLICFGGETSDSSMGKYLEIGLVLLKEVLRFFFDMVKCLTCANIFFRRLSPSFMDLFIAKSKTIYS